MKLFAVFGNPIAHSKSPYLHNFALHKLKIDARYVRICLKNAQDFRRIFDECALSGANVTVPFKESLLESCDEVDEIAQKIGAINTIVRRENRLFGYNTDALGFYENIKREKLKNALIIGAGGSSRAIAFILRQKNIAPMIINRSAERLEFFRQNGFECAEFGEFGESFGAKPFDLIINATSSSINNELPLGEAILRELFKDAKIAFDLMYGKKCPFLELAKISANRVNANHVNLSVNRANLGVNRASNRTNRGANQCKIRAIDGKNMLLYQAIYALSLFLDKPYRTIKTAMTPAFI